MLTLLVFVLNAAAAPIAVKASADIPPALKAKVTYDTKTKTLKAVSGVTITKTSDGKYQIADLAEIYCACASGAEVSADCKTGFKDGAVSCTGSDGSCCGIVVELNDPR